jgi:16S rRNA (guanine527-N7)-methyltransferase
VIESNDSTPSGLANEGDRHLEPPADDSLASALARHHIDLPSDQVEQLDRYCRLLWDWNEKINLTRHTDYERFVARDMVDALALSPLLETGEKMLDVGTGGGVPGVILAIVRPDVSVALCDSVAKKARVVGEMVTALGLDTPVHHGPAQELVEEYPFDTLVFRAVARLPKILTWMQPHWGSFDRLLLIKGPQWVDERGEARHRGLLRGFELRRMASYPLAGTDSESVVLQVRQGE